MTDMLKNPCNPTGFDSNSHKCSIKGEDTLKEDYLATLEVFAGIAGRPFPNIGIL